MKTHIIYNNCGMYGGISQPANFSESEQNMKKGHPHRHNISNFLPLI